MSIRTKADLAAVAASDIPDVSVRARCAHCYGEKPEGNGIKYCSVHCYTEAAGKRLDKTCLRCTKPSVNGLCSTCKYMARFGKTKRRRIKHTAIRMHARLVLAAENIPKICAMCGYSKYVEVCHLRAVKDFPLDAPMAEVNAPSNLRYMCPNCHVEYDRGK